MSYRSSRCVLLAFVLAVGMWSYVNSVLVPHQRAEAARTNAPRGNLSDLYPRWLGTREWLLHGRDPYSDAVTREIQAGYWGRPLDPRNPNDPRDEARFAYPAYVVFFLAPTVWLPFGMVQKLATLILAAGTAFSVLLWLRVLGLRLDRAKIAVAVILVLGSWPVVQGLLLQQLTLLVALLLAASAAALSRGRYGLAGILLALASIKPHIAAPVAFWYVLWMLGDWRRRKRVVWSCLAAMTALLAAGQVAMPGWFTRWCESLSAYLRYNEAEPLLDTLFGQGPGLFLRLLVVIASVVICWRLRRESVASGQFGRVLSIVLVAGLLVMPRWASYDQVFLLPAALWIAYNWHVSRLSARGVRAMCVVVAGWQWVAALALSLLSLVSPALAQRLSVAPLVTSLALPVAAMSALAVQFWRNPKSETSAVTVGAAVSCSRN